jgi:hypothetical protein
MEKADFIFLMMKNTMVIGQIIMPMEKVFITIQMVINTLVIG